MNSCELPAKDLGDKLDMDEDDYTEFSLFAGLNKPQSDKPKYAIMNTQEVFRAIVCRQKEVEVGVLCDIVKLADRIMDGRLLSSGQLTLKDVQNCSKLIETLSKLLQDKKNDLTKSHAKGVEFSAFFKYTAFKENPFAENQPILVLP